MARIGSAAELAGIHTGDRWRLFRNLLGGFIIVAVWLSLWTWVTVGVVQPLSHIAGASGEPAVAVERS